MKKKILIGILCCALLGTMLCGCSSLGNTTAEEMTESAAEETQEVALEDQVYTQDFFAMDTYMVLTAYGEYAQEAVEAAMAEINRLDALLSTGDENSVIYGLNTTNGGEIDEEIAYLIQRAMEIYESTQGLYDITIYPVMDLWGFTGEDDTAFAVPEASVLEETLALVDASKLEITQDEDGTSTISWPEGMQIDLGGLVKGYADDQVTAIFKSYGIEHAVINLGGDVHVLGSKVDGSAWKVGIQDPEDDDGYLGVLALEDITVVTSGGYERYFDDEETGIRYHHIIDPRTGYSAYNGLISVSIISEDGTLADGLSTAIFVMGTEAAIAYCQEHCVSDGFDVLLETEDGEIYITDRIADSFINTNSDRVVNIIETN